MTIRTFHYRHAIYDWPMTIRRPARECAQLVLKALQHFGPSPRWRLYLHTGRNTKDMAHVLQHLSMAEVIDKEPPSDSQGCAMS